MVLLSDADGDKTRADANFSVLVLMDCPGGRVELLIMLLKGLLFLLLMSLMMLMFGELLSLVLVTGQGSGADTDVGDGADGSESTNGSCCLCSWSYEWWCGVDTDAPADYRDSCDATAEVDSDSTNGVTDNVHSTVCAGSISGDSVNGDGGGTDGSSNSSANSLGGSTDNCVSC